MAGLIGVLVGLAGGNTAVLQPRFDAGEWLDLVERHRVQRVFLVPTMLQRILAHPRFARADLSSVQMITYGAAPASADLIARAVEAFPPSVAFIQVFGPYFAAGTEAQTLFADRLLATNADDDTKEAEGILLKLVASSDDKTVVADENYIRESILNPQAKIVQGFGPIMPTFQGQVSEEDLLKLLAYIKSLTKPAAAPAAAAAQTGPQS